MALLTKSTSPLLTVGGCVAVSLLILTPGCGSSNGAEDGGGNGGAAETGGTKGGAGMGGTTGQGGSGMATGGHTGAPLAGGTSHPGAAFGPAGFRRAAVPAAVLGTVRATATGRQDEEAQRDAPTD